MDRHREGFAIVYCEGVLCKTNGNTVHKLMCGSERFKVLSVIDSTSNEPFAVVIVEEGSSRVPVVDSLDRAIENAFRSGVAPTHFVICPPPRGGRLDEKAKEVVRSAVFNRLHVVSGHGEFLSDDPDLAALARQTQVRIIDIHKQGSREAHQAL